jgi:non-specific serine/threonine protein kinase
VRLFVERARAVIPGFTLTADDAHAVAEICRALDGLPLAIELAAARVRLFSPRAMLARIMGAGQGSSLQLVTGGARDLPARHQTLRNAIEWSFDLLNAEEQALFSALSVFAGGFSLEAAESVCGLRDEESGAGSREPVGLLEPIPDSRLPTPSNTAASTFPITNLVEGIASLMDKSLLKQEETGDGEARFSMLETIREYARERLRESGFAESVRGLHSAYFLALAERAEPELRGPEQVVWIGRLEREHDNLRAALGWSLQRGEVEIATRLAASLAWFWFAHGHLTEGRTWLAAVLAAPGEVSPAVRAKALCGAGRIANNQTDYPQANAWLQEGLSLFRRLGDTQGMANALNILGTVAIYSGEYAKAKTYYDESLALFRDLQDTASIAKCLSNLGTVAFFFSDYDQAQTYYEESLALHKELGDKWGVAVLLFNLGEAAAIQGGYREAEELYRESLPILSEIGDKGAIAQCLEGLAGAHGGQHRPLHAARLFGAAEALREATGAPLAAGDRANYESQVESVRGALGEEQFASAWDDGRAMQYEAAVALALAEAEAEEGAPAPIPLPPGTYPDDLTAREVEVLRLIAAGLNNPQMAAQLYLSPHTVQAHVRSIYSKLGVSTRSAATRYAIDNRLA